MKKLIILFIITSIATVYSCGFVIQSLPNMIVRGEGTTFKVSELGIDKTIGRKEETVRNTGAYSVTIKNGEIDSTFTVHLYTDSTVIIDVTPKEITILTTPR